MPYSGSMLSQSRCIMQRNAVLTVGLILQEARRSHPVFPTLSPGSRLTFLSSS